MEKLYNRIDFHNDTVPALNDANLNAMSKAIDDLDNRVINLPTLIGSEAVEICVEAAARAEEVAQSIPSDYSALSAEVQTKADKTQLSNKNLLDNAWFTVNQRGNSGNVANGYGADRWNMVAGYGKFDSNGFTMVGGAIVVCDQYIDTPFETGTYTFSVKKGDKIYTLTKDIVYNQSFGYEQIGTSGIFVNYLSISGKYNIRLYNYESANDITIRAIKLEKGSISTLANDVAPNYADELIKCQGSTADSSDTYANDGVWKNNGNFDYIRKNGVVTIVLANGITVGSDGKTISQSIPIGYRPRKQIETIIKVYDGNSYVDARMYVNTDGAITIVNLWGTVISNMQIAYSVSLSITYVI